MNDPKTCDEPGDGEYSGLYVHVPFCRSFCSYCDFYSELVAGSRNLIGRYLDALEMEISGLPDDFRPGTAYLGGGTPTALDENSLQKLLMAISRRYLADLSEWTCEANPGTLTDEKISVLRGSGVNRVSLGVQTFDERQLELLGRTHTAKAVRDTVVHLRDAGVENLSLDLMYGLPGETMHTLERDIEELLMLQPEHISAYALSVEQNTPIEEDVDRGLLTMPDDDLCAGQYEMVCRLLKAAGYRHYEISNFALPGRECRHNLLYWGSGNYYGCGPAAHSHINGERWGNVTDIHVYSQRLSGALSPCGFRERLAPEARARELLIMGLRRLNGVYPDRIMDLTGCDTATLRDDLAQLISEGRLMESGGRLWIPEEYLYISDDLFRRLV